MSKIIEVNFPEGKRVNAEIDGRIIYTDQSVQTGGEGTAPEPFQLFLASIATCAGFYALNFCQARQISTEGMSLSMTCDFDRDVKLYTHIKISLDLPKNFPETYKDAIIRAMDLCAVKKHLLNSPEFVVIAT
jgi:ribosomal protein S12 methylthiotransferase accessory factor